jgi:hypothetical protein
MQKLFNEGRSNMETFRNHVHGGVQERVRPELICLPRQAGIPGGKKRTVRELTRR